MSELGGHQSARSVKRFRLAKTAVTGDDGCMVSVPTPSRMDEASMIPHAKGLMEGLEMGRAELFPHIYDLLIARPKGPKLTTLIGTMGAARALPLLEESLK